jgi:DNA-binding FadR family transcriptional regulator
MPIETQERPNVTILPIKATATYELVADQLRKAIILGRFLPGQRLPPERDLASQLGVSRTTVREAVRVLEGEGLVVSRRGATGGIVVMPWFSQGDQHKLRFVVEARYRELAAIFEFRLPNEAETSRLAAERRTAPEARELEALSASMSALTRTRELRSHIPNIARFLADDNAFHLLIARASRNEHLFAAVERARTQMFLPIGGVFDRLEDDANDFHTEIASAIVRQDGAAAESAMRRHITSTLAGVRAFLERVPLSPP